MRQGSIVVSLESFEAHEEYRAREGCPEVSTAIRKDCPQRGYGFAVSSQGVPVVLVQMAMVDLREPGE